MNGKEIVKVFVATSLTILLFFGIIIIVLFISPNEMGLVFGGVFAFILICVLLYSVYPVVFKDYIDRYWKNVEEKKCQEKE